MDMIGAKFECSFCGEEFYTDYDLDSGNQGQVYCGYHEDLVFTYGYGKVKDMVSKEIEHANKQ